MIKSMPFPLRGILPVLLPLAAVVLARLMTFTDWAATNAEWAAAIFAWIVLDGLALGLMAKAPRHKPSAHQMLGVFSLSTIIVLVGASDPVRAVYLGLPEVLTALALTVLLFLVWSIYRCFHAYRKSGSMEQALCTVLPELQVRFLLAELRTIRIALFSWGAAPDVPAGSRSFVYHTYLTPMIATFVALQLIELSVMHLLLMLWNPTVAWVLLALSVWGVIWTVALLKSFRLYPVLLTDRAVRVRSGMIYDFEVPLDIILNSQNSFTSEELKEKGVLNLAIMSSPNVNLRFTRPISIGTFFGGRKEISGVAMRLDDSAAFLAALGPED